MRILNDVIDQVLKTLPVPPPPELADDLIVLAAELRILKRASAYNAPEAVAQAELWLRFSTALYRYLPNPKGYAFAQQISDIVQV